MKSQCLQLDFADQQQKSIIVYKNLAFALPHQLIFQQILSYHLCFMYFSFSLPFIFQLLQKRIILYKNRTYFYIFLQYFFLYFLEMELPEAVNVAKQIEQDLQKYANNPKISQQIINGTGFKSLNFGKDFLKCQIPKANLEHFLADYLKSMQIQAEVKKQLQQFCQVLVDVEKLKWKKFQCLYQDSNFKGSWIGVYYHLREDGQCQFISHYMSCSFKLMPDVFILRTEEEDGFLMFQNKKTRVVMIEKERGFTKQDYMAVMNICSSMENIQYSLQ